MSLFRLKGASGPVINRTWELEERAVIGRSPNCAIHIESEAVASRHAELEVANGRVTLRLLERGGELFLNGAAVTESSLASGDEIRIGSCRWLMQAPGLKPEKILTEAAVRRRIRLLPWLIAGGLSALGLLAWWLGFLPF
jgi:hypothetical protein